MLPKKATFIQQSIIVTLSYLVLIAILFFSYKALDNLKNNKEKYKELESRNLREIYIYNKIQQEKNCESSIDVTLNSKTFIIPELLTLFNFNLEESVRFLNNLKLSINAKSDTNKNSYTNLKLVLGSNSILNTSFLKNKNIITLSLPDIYNKNLLFDLDKLENTLSKVGIKGFNLSQKQIKTNEFNNIRDALELSIMSKKFSDIYYKNINKNLTISTNVNINNNGDNILCDKYEILFSKNQFKELLNSLLTEAAKEENLKVILKNTSNSTITNIQKSITTISQNSNNYFNSDEVKITVLLHKNTIISRKFELNNSSNLIPRIYLNISTNNNLKNDFDSTQIQLESVLGLSKLVMTAKITNKYSSNITIPQLENNNTVNIDDMTFFQLLKLLKELQQNTSDYIELKKKSIHNFSHCN